MPTNTLPPGAVQTTLRFDIPGEIEISTRSGNPFRFNLEEVWPKLRFTAYDAGNLQGWEAVFRRLATDCKLRRLEIEESLHLNYLRQ